MIINIIIIHVVILGKGKIDNTVYDIAILSKYPCHDNEKVFKLYFVKP